MVNKQSLVELKTQQIFEGSDPKTYRVGIDVGLYSVGLAAVEIGTPENPADFPLLAPQNRYLAA